MLKNFNSYKHKIFYYGQESMDKTGDMIEPYLTAEFKKKLTANK